MRSEEDCIQLATPHRSRISLVQACKYHSSSHFAHGSGHADRIEAHKRPADSDGYLRGLVWLMHMYLVGVYSVYFTAPCVSWLSQEHS